MPKPAPLDLEVTKGDTLDVFVRVKRKNAVGALEYMNLTGWKPKAQVRASAGSATVDATFTCTISDQTGDTLGGVLLHLPIIESDKLTTGNKVWDFEITNPGDTERRTLIGGKFVVFAGVTT